jgi:hypothetical protein
MHKIGKDKKADATENPIGESIPPNYGGPNHPAFIKKNGLNKASRAVDWFAPFMLRRCERKEAPKFHIGY